MAAAPLLALPSLDNGYGSIFIGMVVAAGSVIDRCISCTKTYQMQVMGYWNSTDVLVCNT